MGGGQPFARALAVFHTLMDALLASQRIAETGHSMDAMDPSDYVIVSRPGGGDEVRNNDGDFPEHLSDIDTLIDNNARSLWPLCNFIHEHPELAYREYKAHHALTDFIRARDEGWEVMPSAFGIATAWIAVHDSGKPGPVVSFNVEMGEQPISKHHCHLTRAMKHIF